MKKIVPILVIVLVSITLIAVAAFSLYHFLLKNDSEIDGGISIEEPRKITAEERQELTVSVNDVVTNLADMEYIVKLSMDFVLENVEAKDELSLLTSSVKSIIVKTLADTKPEEMQGSQGQSDFNAKIMNEVNTILQEGKLMEVQITDIIITEQ